MSDEQPPPTTATGLYAHADFAVGSVLASRFRIEAMLGVGGMGVVYRATDLALDVQVALKLLRPELANRSGAFERFRQELLLARQVSNPHVVRIHDFAQHEGRWLISMDYVDGESLDRRLDRDGTFALDEALRITRQLAEGLGAAHAQGVVHRDLKPANVLLDTQGNAYISDFGVARSLASTGLTQSGTIVGTPEYLSPEQARGATVDARSDLYALGLILYEMLAGNPPFSGGTVAEILAQRLVRTPEPLSQHRKDAPAWVVRLVDKLLRPQPAHRFRDATAVIAAIDKREVAREFRPGRMAWIGVATVLALALGVGAWWLQREQAPAIAASPPLERLLLMPIVPDARSDGVSAARAAALSAHLRDALAAVPGLAVVDGERTAQALRQLDPTGAARLDIGTLRTVAAAQRILQPHLIEDHGRWRLHAELHAGSQAPQWIDGPVAADPLAALRAWAAAATTARALGLHEVTLDLQLPASTAALDAYGAGQLAWQHGQLAEAGAQLRVATKAAPDYAAAWLAQVETALAIGEQDAAFAALDQGQHAAAGAPRHLQRRFIAERAMLENNPPAAVAEWRALLAATPDDTQAELNLARAQGTGGDFTAAVAGLQKLTARDAQDPRAWFELGKFSILQGAARRAVDDYLVRALVLYKRSGNRFGEAETVNALGIGYGRLGQTDDAIEQYRKAIELRRAVGNRRGEATSLRNLGTELSLAGKFDEAAAALARARTLHAALDDRAGLAAVENEMGLLAEARGDFRGALAAFRRALQAWQQLDDPLGKAQALNDIGFAHYQLGAYDDAQVYLQQAATGYAEIGDQTGRVRTEQDLGLLATARGRWNEARRLLQQSLASAEQQQMPEEAAVSHRNLAELELLQGHLGTAIEQASKAEALFKQREDPRGQADAALLRVQALLAMHADGDAASALDALQPVLAQASIEQRAIAASLRTQLAQRRGDDHQAQQSLAEAARLAAASGVQALQLQVALLSPSAGSVRKLDAGTAALGHVALRLGWLEAAMTQALARGDGNAAVSAYRDAQVLLRAGEFGRAGQLHALGARALAMAGNSAGATSATAAARLALQQLRATIPAPQQAAFDTATASAKQGPAR